MQLAASSRGGYNGPRQLMATLRSKEKAARRPLSYWSATPTGRETHLCVDLSRQSGEVWDCKKKAKKAKKAWMVCKTQKITITRVGSGFMGSIRTAGSASLRSSIIATMGQRRCG